jgi:hypothetical protein
MLLYFTRKLLAISMQKYEYMKAVVETSLILKVQESYLGNIIPENYFRSLKCE